MKPMTIRINNEEFVAIKLPDGMTIEQFNEELRLLKGTYGRSNNRASLHLDEYLKHNKSCLGLK